MTRTLSSHWQAIFSSDQIVHERVRAIARTTRDRDKTAMAKLIDIVFDTPLRARLADEIGSHFRSDDLVRSTPPPSTTHRAVEIADHAFAHRIEGAVVPHMHTLAVTIRLLKALAWLLTFQAWRIGAV